MQFALNEDQIAVRDMARDFAAEKIAPHAIRWDEEKHFPVDVMREAAKLGIGGVYISDDVGGSGLTRFDAALAPFAEPETVRPDEGEFGWTAMGGWVGHFWSVRNEPTPGLGAAPRLSPRLVHSGKWVPGIAARLPER